MNINKRVGTGARARCWGACTQIGVQPATGACGGGIDQRERSRGRRWCREARPVGATYRRLHTQFIACRNRRRCLYTVMMLLSVYIFCVHVYYAIKLYQI